MALNPASKFGSNAEKKKKAYYEKLDPNHEALKGPGLARKDRHIFNRTDG